MLVASRADPAEACLRCHARSQRKLDQRRVSRWFLCVRGNEEAKPPPKREEPVSVWNVRLDWFFCFLSRRRLASW